MIRAAKRAKKPRLSWIEGFELREQFPSSGDFKYIDSKMHNTMGPALAEQLYSGYEILQVSQAVTTSDTRGLPKIVFA